MRVFGAVIALVNFLLLTKETSSEVIPDNLKTERVILMHAKGALAPFMGNFTNYDRISLNASHDISFADVTRDSEDCMRPALASIGAVMQKNEITKHDEIANAGIEDEPIFTPANNETLGLSTVYKSTVRESAVKQHDKKRNKKRATSEFIVAPPHCGCDSTGIDYIEMDTWPKLSLGIYKGVRTRIIHTSGSSVEARACNDHSNQVFAIVAAKVKNKPYGVVTGKNRNVLFIPVFTCAGYETDEDSIKATLAARDVAVENNAIGRKTVINKSVSGGRINLIKTAATVELTNVANTVYVISAGNTRSIDSCGYGIAPYNDLDLFNVAASAPPGNKLAYFASSGQGCVDIVAPGIFPDYKGKVFKGSSASAPIVAGKTICTWKANPNEDKEVVKGIVVSHTKPITLTTYPGAGQTLPFIPKAKACATAKIPTNAPTPAPTAIVFGSVKLGQLYDVPVNPICVTFLGSTTNAAMSISLDYQIIHFKIGTDRGPNKNPRYMHQIFTSQELLNTSYTSTRIVAANEREFRVQRDMFFRYSFAKREEDGSFTEIIAATLSRVPRNTIAFNGNGVKARSGFTCSVRV